MNKKTSCTISFFHFKVEVLKLPIFLLRLAEQRGIINVLTQNLKKNVSGMPRLKGEEKECFQGISELILAQQIRWYI